MKSIKIGDKSEAVVIGTAAQLKYVTAIRTVTVAGTSLSHKLKSLGVTLDDHLRFDSRVIAVTKACTFHTHALRHVAYNACCPQSLP